MNNPTLIFFLCFPAFWAAGAVCDAAQVSRPYRLQGAAHPESAILLQGSPREVQFLSRWLDRIAAVPKGFQTLDRIAGSGHRLVIQHSDTALLSAGRTMAPMSSNLINGKGESVQILFNAHIPDRGSHMVIDGKGKLVEYTAIQNLYHELAHAMHKMCGTWRYFNSEKQAIEEENLFRRDLALMQNKPPVFRFRKRGVLISDVDNTVVVSEWFGPTLVSRHPLPKPQLRLFSTGVAP